MKTNSVKSKDGDCLNKSRGDPASEWGFAEDTRTDLCSSDSSSRPSTSPYVTSILQQFQRPSTSPVNSTFDREEIERNLYLQTEGSLNEQKLKKMRTQSRDSYDRLTANDNGDIKFDELLRIGQQYHAATIIESLVRMHLTKLHVWAPGGYQHQYCAIQIQRVCRGFAVRHRAEIDLKNKRHHAAWAIQTMVRGRVARMFVKVMLASKRLSMVVRLQRMVRGMIGRTRVRNIRFALRQAAATRIQAQWRRHDTMKFRGPVAARRQERAVQRRSMTLFISGMTRRAYENDRKKVTGQNKDPEIDLWLRMAMCLHVIERKTIGGMRVLSCLQDSNVAVKVAKIILRLSTNEDVPQQLALLVGIRRAANNTIVDALNATYKVFIRDVFSACLSQRPSDCHAALNLGLVLLVLHYIERGNGNAFLLKRGERLLKRSLSLSATKRAKEIANANWSLYKYWWAPSTNEISVWCATVPHLNQESSNFVTVRLRGAWFVLELEDHASLPLVVSARDVGDDDDPGVLGELPYSSKMVETYTKTLVRECRLHHSESEPSLVIPYIYEKHCAARLLRQSHTSARVIQHMVHSYLNRKRWREQQARDEIERLEQAKIAAAAAAKQRAIDHQHEMVSKVKAAFLGYKTRQRLAVFHAAAIQCQRIIRGLLGRLKAISKQQYLLFGARIVTMFSRGRCVSGQFLHVEVFRSGYQWLVRGHSLENGCSYQGLLPHQHVMQLVKKNPYGLDSIYSGKKAERLHIWHHERVCALIIMSLSLTTPIAGLGELNGYDGTRTFICHLTMKSHAHGRGILDTSGLGRLLSDTKSIVFPEPGTKYFKERERQKRIRAKTAPKNYNPRVEEILPRASTAI